MKMLKVIGFTALLALTSNAIAQERAVGGIKSNTFSNDASIKTLSALVQALANQVGELKTDMDDGFASIENCANSGLLYNATSDSCVQANEVDPTVLDHASTAPIECREFQAHAWNPTANAWECIVTREAQNCGSYVDGARWYEFTGNYTYENASNTCPHGGNLSYRYQVEEQYTCNDGSTVATGLTRQGSRSGSSGSCNPAPAPACSPLNGQSCSVRHYWVGSSTGCGGANCKVLGPGWHSGIQHSCVPDPLYSGGYRVNCSAMAPGRYDCNGTCKIN